MKLGYDGHGINYRDGERRGERIVTFAARPQRDGGGYSHTREEMDRMGALLAAAPDMLEALEEALVAFDGEEESVKREHRETIQKLRDTITKATNPRG